MSQRAEIHADSPESLKLYSEWSLSMGGSSTAGWEWATVERYYLK